MRRLNRVSGLLLGSVAALSIAAAPALAAVNVKSEPFINFAGAGATISGGNFSGLGNLGVTGELEVDGVANYNCHNNGNPSNIVPGQNPVDAAGGTTGEFNLPTSKNGRAYVPEMSAFITAPPTPSAQSVGCGGKGAVNNWTVELESLVATSATFTVREGGVMIFQWVYYTDGNGTLVYP